MTSSSDQFARNCESSARFSRSMKALPSKVRTNSPKAAEQLMSGPCWPRPHLKILPGNLAPHGRPKVLRASSFTRCLSVADRMTFAICLPDRRLGRHCGKHSFEESESLLIGDPLRGVRVVILTSLRQPYDANRFDTLLSCSRPTRPKWHSRLSECG